MAEEEEEKINPRVYKPDLYLAVQSNNAEKALEYLSLNVPPTYVDPVKGLTPLHWAAIHGNISLMRKLTQCGATAPYHRLLKEKAQAENVNKFTSKSQNSPSKRVGETIETGDISEESKDQLNDIPLPRENSEKEEEDDEEEDDEESITERKLETSEDLLKNTPLLWAAFKGHLPCVWHLIMHNYSPNDLDNFGNNALHLAAAGTNLQVVKTLIDDGANPNLVNLYKNVPAEMTSNRDIRELLVSAMASSASMTKEDSINMHQSNVKMYAGLVRSLDRAISEALQLDLSPASLRTMSSTNRSVGEEEGEEFSLGADISDLGASQGFLVPSEMEVVLSNLAQALRVSREWALDETTIAKGEDLYSKLESYLELANEVNSLQQRLPIRTQRDYISLVHPLEKAIQSAKTAGLDQIHLNLAQSFVCKCQAEQWLSTLMDRVKHIACASEDHEHDMNKLAMAVNRARSMKADETLVREASQLSGRLSAELSLSRAISSIPSVRLPIPEPVPEGYWQEEDTGHIRETEEYPLPPADSPGDQYLWEPSSARTTLLEAVNRLRDSFAVAEAYGAEKKLLSEGKDKLKIAEANLQKLDLKDSADYAAAVEVAKKLAKKLKKKGKSPKKK